MSRLELGNELKEDDKVKVISGPFSGMFGVVKGMDMEHQQVEVIIDLFGQETTVELGIAEIEKA